MQPLIPDGSLSQERNTLLVLTTLETLTTRPRKVCFRSSFGHSPASGHARAFDPTFTTAAFDRSSSDWFETCARTPVPRGPPSSPTQLYSTTSVHTELLSCLCGTAFPLVSVLGSTNSAA